MPQEHTGEWYVLINNQWGQGRTLQAQSQPPAPYAQSQSTHFTVPPVYQAPQANAQTVYPNFQQPLAGQPIQAIGYRQPMGNVQRPVNMVSTKGGMSVGLSLLFWFIGFSAAAVIFYLIAKDTQVILVVGIVAAISLILILINAASAWEGRIYDIRTTRERHRDSDGNYETRTVTYAYIEQPDGKTKKVKAGGGWQIGDYVQKRRGETTPRLFKS